MSLVYFISDGEYIKIGKTTNLKKRMGHLQCSNARRLTVLHTIESEDADYIAELESKLHDIFSEYRVVGEWFSLNWEDMHKVVLRIEENLEKEISSHNDRMMALSNEWDRRALQNRLDWLVSQDIQNNYPPMKHGQELSFSSGRFGNPTTPIIRPSFAQNLKPRFQSLGDKDEVAERRFNFNPTNEDGTPRKSRFA